MKIIGTDDEFLSFQMRNKKGFQESSLRRRDSYIDCSISGVIRILSASDSGVKPGTPIARSNKNRTTKNATDRLKDMRKDDIVTEKETAFRAKRVIRASNNRRRGGIDEFIIGEMGTTGKMEQNIKKGVIVINSIKRRKSRATAVEVSQTGGNRRRNRTVITLMDKSDGNAHVGNRATKLRIAVKAIRLMGVIRSKTEVKNGVELLT